MRRPAVANLVHLHSVVCDRDPAVIVRESEGLQVPPLGLRAADADGGGGEGSLVQTAEYKGVVAEAVVARFEGIRAEWERVRADEAGLVGTLEAGSAAARSTAALTMDALQRLLDSPSPP